MTCPPIGIQDDGCPARDTSRSRKATIEGIFFDLLPRHLHQYFVLNVRGPSLPPARSLPGSEPRIYIDRHTSRDIEEGTAHVDEFVCFSVVSCQKLPVDMLRTI